MLPGAAGGASDWLGGPPPVVVAAAAAAGAAQPLAAGAAQHAVPPPVVLAAAAAAGAAQPQAAIAAQHAVPPPVVLAAAAAAGTAQPQAGGIGGASPAPEAQQYHNDPDILTWILRERPHLVRQVFGAPEGRRCLPLDAVLAPGDQGATVLHLMIDCLRNEARERAQGIAAETVPWDAVLRLPGVGQFANTPVATGGSKGKTPLCYLAAQRMPGERFRDACRAICTWLLSMNATADLAACPAKCPLMLAAGSGNADFVDLLLNARASVDAEGGPSLGAVLFAVRSTKGDGLNQGRMIRCLESRGFAVNSPHMGPGGGTASRRSSSAHVTMHWPAAHITPAAVTRHGQAAPITRENTDLLWSRYRAERMTTGGWVPGPGEASPFGSSAGAAPAQQGTAGIAPARAPAPAVAAPAVAAPADAAPAVAAPAIAEPQVAAPGAAAPAVAVKACPPNAAAAPQPPPAGPPPPMAAPWPAAAQPFNNWWQAAGGGGWGSSASHAQAAGGGGGWGIIASPMAAPAPAAVQPFNNWQAAGGGGWGSSASNPSGSSSSGARPNTGEADRVWWWSAGHHAWLFSPPGISPGQPGQGRWAWTACWGFALWFEPPPYTL